MSRTTALHAPIALFQILSFHTENDKYFVELMPLISVKDGKAKEQFNITDSTARRRKRATFSRKAKVKFSKNANEQVYTRL